MLQQIYKKPFSTLGPFNEIRARDDQSIFIWNTKVNDYFSLYEMG